MTEVITEDELFAEFDRLGVLGETGDQGVTTQELASHLGITLSQVRKRLHRARELGILRVGKRKTVRLDERQTSVPCYWFERNGEG